jgi:hypothetical protein
MHRPGDRSDDDIETGADSAMLQVRSGDTWTVDAICRSKGKSYTQHLVIRGNFDSGYTMTDTMEGDDDVVPGGKTTTMTTARWLGPCATDWKPGDDRPKLRNLGVEAKQSKNP